MKQIAVYSTPTEASLVVARLKSCGIEALIRDELTITNDWSLSNAIGGVRVEVSDSDYADAKTILELPHSENGVVFCPHCKSDNTKFRVLSFWGALCFIIKLPVTQKKATVDCMQCKRSFSVRINGQNE